MALLLIKTEPGDYSWDDLVREKRTTWAGVRNAAALLHLRAARKGDRALIYHTGGEKRVVGLAEVVKGPYPDPEADPPDERRVVIDLAPRKAANPPVTLASIKADRRFADFALVRQSRLSVMPVQEPLAPILLKMAGLA